MIAHLQIVLLVSLIFSTFWTILLIFRITIFCLSLKLLKMLLHLLVLDHIWWNFVKILFNLKIGIILFSPWGRISVLIGGVMVLSMSERALVFSLSQYLVGCFGLKSFLSFVRGLSIRGFHICGGSQCVLYFGNPLRVSLLGARPAIILRNSLRIFVFSVRIISC